MNDIKKNKSANSLLEEYLNEISNKCEKQIPVIKKKNILKDASNIPQLNEYNHLIYNNYNNAQLKTIAKHYKIKVGGNKPQLITRIYNYLYFSSRIIKIQKIFRGYLVKKYKWLRGPAVMNRKLCTNADDFITMEPLEEISFQQFISYKDVDGFIYGFDITSLHNLFLKSEDEIRNPYNRNIIPNDVFKNIRSIIRYSRILKMNVMLSLEDDTKNVSDEKAFELKTITLFQNINALGNYSNANWFLSLDRYKLIKFLRELVEIWKYRAQLPIQTKRAICPPHGNPFRHVNLAYLLQEENLHNIKKVILNVMENLVYSGVDKDSKALGSYYVLGALTLVNDEASSSMPWLFQSFGYF